MRTGPTGGPDLPLQCSLGHRVDGKLRSSNSDVVRRIPHLRRLWNLCSHHRNELAKKVQSIDAGCRTMMQNIRIYRNKAKPYLIIYMTTVEWYKGHASASNNDSWPFKNSIVMFPFRKSYLTEVYNLETGCLDVLFQPRFELQRFEQVLTQRNLQAKQPSAPSITSNRNSNYESYS